MCPFTKLFVWLNVNAFRKVARLYFLSQASAVNGLIADEYLKNASTPEDIRDAYTEIMGDLLMTLPVSKVVGHLAGLKCQDKNSKAAELKMK